MLSCMAAYEKSLEEDSVTHEPRQILWWWKDSRSSAGKALKACTVATTGGRKDSCIGSQQAVWLPQCIQPFGMSTPPERSYHSASDFQIKVSGFYCMCQLHTLVMTMHRWTSWGTWTSGRRAWTKGQGLQQKEKGKQKRRCWSADQHMKDFVSQVIMNTATYLQSDCSVRSLIVTYWELVWPRLIGCKLLNLSKVKSPVLINCRYLHKAPSFSWPFLWLVSGPTPTELVLCQLGLLAFYSCAVSVSIVYFPPITRGFHCRGMHGLSVVLSFIDLVTICIHNPRCEG